MPVKGKGSDEKETAGSTVELHVLSKMFPERMMDDIHIGLKKHGGDLEATAWELLAERGVFGPCHHEKATNQGSYAKELTHAHHPTYSSYVCELQGSSKHPNQLLVMTREDMQIGIDVKINAN